MVRTFQTIAADKGFKRLFRSIEIVSAKDYSPTPGDLDYVSGRGSDAPWMRRYRKDGGKVIISGNTKMPRVPQELLAIQECDMVVFFFPNEWNGWRFLRKSALILAWMERIIAQAKATKHGAMFRIPNNWTSDATFLVIRSPTPLKLAEVGHTMRSRADKAKLTKKRQKAKNDDSPGLFDDIYREGDEKE